MQKPAPVYSSQLVLRPETDSTYVHFENGHLNPFQAQPKGFPRVNAWWLVDAALLSYWEPPDAIPRFERAGFEAQFLETASTDCYFARSNDALFVVFRGTEPDQWSDILTNARLRLVPWDDGRGRVHEGFKAALDSLWERLHTEIARLAGSRTIWFTGHSLGAALATLAADRLGRARGVCTLGSPRVGDREFADAFDVRLEGRSLRYVNRHDVVTHVPPPGIGPRSYRHVEARRFIDRNGQVSTQPPVLLHFFADLIGDPERLLEVMEAIDRNRLQLAPQFLLDHMPKAYAIWTWNDHDAHGN